MKCPKCGHDYGDPTHSNERDYILTRDECPACTYEQLPEKDKPMYGEFFRAAIKSLEEK